MRERKLISNGIRFKKNKRFSATIIQEKHLIYRSPLKIDSFKPKISEGYVQSQVHSISSQTPPPSPPYTRRNSSEIDLTQVTAEQIMTNNRKASLKKMGSCAITIKNEDGTHSVYVRK